MCVYSRDNFPADPDMGVYVCTQRVIIIYACVDKIYMIWMHVNTVIEVCVEIHGWMLRMYSFI